MSAKQLFDELLAECVKRGASDLHLTANAVPVYRVDGRLRQGDEPLSVDRINEMFDAIMSDYQREEFRTRNTVDIGYSDPFEERFRINLYRQRKRPAAAIRHLDQRLLSLEQLGLPVELRKLATLKNGLVLITGVTGSGKSTTLAALIDEINRDRECHIMTVEDPVEFVHKNKKSLVHHRELGSDVPDYASAVRSFMRQDPDVIMVGEMRDTETMNAAIVAAETGHLVFSTLHTGEAVGAVERFIGYFSGSEQAVARHRIALTLRAVVAQQLLPTANGRGRVPLIELLIVNTAVSSMIENAKTRQIFSVMEGGIDAGMWTQDQALARLVKGRQVVVEDAYKVCRHRSILDGLLAVEPGRRGR